MRFASIDILRTVAIVVMVFVHFGENLSGYTPWMSGFGAPLFVFLSGASYFLWSDGRLARGASEEEVTKVSVRRGLFVFGAGFAFNLLVWLPEGIFNWDVLTFIGAALLFLNVVRHMPGPVRVLVAVMAALVAPVLRGMAGYASYWENGYFECDLTLSDVLIGFLSTGYFPIFPWIAFSVAGYVTAAWMFARPVPGVDRTVNPWVPARVGLALVAASVALGVARPFLPASIASVMLGGWTMFPPTTEYVLGALGMAMTLLSLGHRFVDLNPAAQRFTGALGVARTFSGCSLTIYVLHHLVHVWPLWAYGLAQVGEPTEYWGKALPVWSSMALAAVFLVACWLVLRLLGPGRSWGLERCMRWLCD